MTTEPDHEPALATVNPDPHNPMEVTLLVFVAAAGINYLAGNVPGSMADIFTATTVTVLGAGHVIAGALALVGLFRRQIVLQQLGLAIVAIVVLFYPVALILSVGWSAAGPAGYALAFVIASAWKYTQLQKKITAGARFVKDHRA